MATKVAINGFGRIGRLLFRKMWGDSKFDIVAINDLADISMLAHLLKYDSVQGRFEGHEVSFSDDKLIVDGKEVKVYANPDPSQLPWSELGIDIVAESTGFFVSKDKASAHLKAGAKKVLISAPAGKDLPTVVYGTNHEILTKEDTVVSAASCTTNCLAPMTKALNDYKEITSGFMTTIHAYTSSQVLVDTPGKKGDLRSARAGAINVVPNSTGAAKAIGLVIPELSGKLTGAAQRIPVATGSLTILDATVIDESNSITVDSINEMMKKVADDSYGYTEDQIVSSDIIGITYGSLFDATQTDVLKCGENMYQVRVVSWYDNEMSYVSQMVRTLDHMGAL